MKGQRPRTTFLCNGASVPDGGGICSVKLLGYRSDVDGHSPNVRIDLPDFCRQVFHIPDRHLDLLEIAAYVIGGDRLSSRGSRTAVEYHSWSRDLRFVVRVRDFEFWKQDCVRESLAKLLEFMTGDYRIEFEFQPGHSTPASSLFDKKEFLLDPSNDHAVLLFSGGLDSLAGAAARLNESNDSVCLVSHLSQLNTGRTQRGLVGALADLFPGRVFPYEFRTHLRQVSSVDETQRSRLFLFGCVAFAIAHTYNLNRFFVYENGITSLNLSRREDLVNARASRTTHPRAVNGLAEFLSMVAGRTFNIDTPFFWKTKSEVVGLLSDLGHAHLISSSVSCSHKLNSAEGATHCGECYQCLDRRMAIYSAGLHDSDNEELYAKNFIAEKISSSDGTKTIFDYLRQAARFAAWDKDEFYEQMAPDLSLAYRHVPGNLEDAEFVSELWNLSRRHGTHVRQSLEAMRTKHEDVLQPLPCGSLLKVVSQREFLEDPKHRLVEEVRRLLSEEIPRVFRSTQPKDETQLNDAVEAVLSARKVEFEREYPTASFACVRAVADFGLVKGHVLIESKYVRGSTTPTKVTESVSADLIQYPEDCLLLFLIYDPERKIADRRTFVRDLESEGRCTILICP